MKLITYIGCGIKNNLKVGGIACEKEDNIFGY